MGRVNRAALPLHSPGDEAQVDDPRCWVYNDVG